MIESVSASVNDVELWVGSRERLDLPGPTSGKLCLNAVYNSSEGFWELLLQDVSIENYD